MMRRIFFLKRRCRLLLVLIGALLGSSVLVVSADEPFPEQTFELEVVSIFDPVPDDSPIKDAINSARRGNSVYCGKEPLKGVVYPEFVSDSPFYGEWELRNSLFGSGPDLEIAIVIDESQGTGTGYDRFFVDVNGNGDLTDELPLPQIAATEKQVRNLLPSYFGNDDGDWSFFDPIQLSCADSESFNGLTFHPVAVEGESTLDTIDGDEGPREPERFVTVFFRDPEIRMGEISLGGKTYLIALDIFSAADYSGSGVFFQLQPIDEDSPSDLDLSWWGAEYATASHYVDGHYYKWRASPDGKLLTVYPCEGDTGIVRVEMDELRLEQSQEKMIGMSGSLFGLVHAAPLEAREEDESVDSEHGVQQASIPVGDYTINYASFTLGDIVLDISNMYHEDGRPRKTPEPIFGIHIREDESFVLDFTNTPEVLFALPAQATELKPNDVIEVKPVLVDTELGIMYRDMRDNSQQVEHSYEIGDETHSYMGSKSMDPTIMISDSSGNILGSGIAEYG